ncbi:MAG: hypothetical protein HN444_05580 [Euryarchaeota archaeon]|jgi:hypothetical protein|nr:MAG: hypothetical protein MG2_0198 [uncultured Candidatus Poseidoniales archaeon]MBT3452811.1 hypothetical protein [Euryarchaeota archaeon]MDA8557278.1 hypothetical protein [Candidatus Poseidoniales archaeon]MDB0004696.1 hypothetical protein [Candidatus Poseidoniaceae archaeon]MBT5726605.1 hypothetical protein [Euryarchaeota archaeon]
MSMPRRAMKEMGFQACCLLCDAPDEDSAIRCKSCISHHREVRDVLAKAPADSSLHQFAKEILMMAAAPHRHDHDEIHGPALTHQQRLASAMTEQKPMPSNEDIVEVFERQRAKKASLEVQLAEQEIERINQAMYVDQTQLKQYGSRTVPSHDIAQVDRSDRIGEDTELTDRLEAATEAQTAPKELVDGIEERVFEERQKNRKAWKSTLLDVKELLDDDLDL